MFLYMYPSLGIPPWGESRGILSATHKHFARIISLGMHFKAVRARKKSCELTTQENVDFIRQTQICHENNIVL